MAGHGSQGSKHAREDRRGILDEGREQAVVSGGVYSEAGCSLGHRALDGGCPPPVKGMGEGDLGRAELDAAAFEVDA